MKIKNDKLYKTITLLTIMIIGIGLYFVIQNGFGWISDESQPKSVSIKRESDDHGHSLKIIKHNQEKFATKSIKKQDQILQQTKSIKVSKNEVAKKKKVTDEMETTLDKKIIGEISSLQNDVQPLDKADELNQEIQQLQSLSPQEKAQFGQEIQGIKQTIQTTN